MFTRHQGVRLRSQRVVLSGLGQMCERGGVKHIG